MILILSLILLIGSQDQVDAKTKPQHGGKQQQTAVKQVTGTSQQNPAASDTSATEQRGDYSERNVTLAPEKQRGFSVGDGAAIAAVIVAFLAAWANFLMWHEMKEQTQHMRESFEATQRAFIVIGDLGDPQGPAIDLDAGRDVNFSVQITNAGRSTATNITARADTALAESFPEEPPFRHEKIPFVLEAGAVRNMLVPIDALSKQALKEIGEKKRHLYLYFDIEYLDGFGHGRVTRHAFRLDPAARRWADLNRYNVVT